ncbi:kinesin-like protein [Trichonephila clavipes]|nr:kinesin-like protein [Trichonephila clavipes]
MDWPAYSPNLNPIEHVWDMLGRRIPARQPPATCLPELRSALLDEWCNIPQDQIDNLILSMPRRSTRGLLAKDHVILNHGQVTWTTPELAPPLLTTTPHQREDVSALDRFNVHRCPARGATAHKSQGLQCPYQCMGPKVHEQMFQSGG